jgi:hypothetical protein
MDRARDENRAIYLRDLPRDMGKDAKGRRMESLQEDFACGQIYFHESQRDLIGEYHSNPMGVDDLVDALGYHKYWWTRSNPEAVEKNRLEQESKWQFEAGITGYGGLGY